MGLAEWTALLSKEALTLKVLLATRAVEALAMVVVVKGFDPAISSLNWEPTGKAFRGEQLIPISLTVRKTVLQKEWAVSKKFATIRAVEALGVEMLANRVQAIPLDLLAALITSWSKELFKAELAIEVTFLLNEAAVL